MLGSNVEHLTLLDGPGHITTTGSTANNVIVGQTSSNSINGGFRNDTLTGGLGVDADLFVFDTTLNAAANVDHIADFNDAN